jgi:hypothetical protein
MTGDTGLRKGWKRLLVILCTLLLAGSVLLVFGVMGWAQDADNEAPQEDTGTEAETQEEGTETPAEEGQETGEEAEAISEEQPPAEEEPLGELTIDYWEPQLGTRTVYHTEDGMDIHGDLYGTSYLGYWDDLDVWISTWFPLISIRQDFLDYSDYYYKSVEAISNMNPCYFQLEGPWYFNMTTPWKYVEEVIGIHEAPDAHLYPEATYAVNFLYIWSGGRRITGTAYRSNSQVDQKWYEYGFTRVYFEQGNTEPTKEVIYYRSPHDKKTSSKRVIASFPLTLGSTGVIDAVYIEGGIYNETSSSVTYEVVSEGEITVPGGTFDAVMLKYNISEAPNGTQHAWIGYGWMVQDVGNVADVTSLPDIVDDPLYETATSIYVMEEQTGAVGGEQQ